MLRRPLVPEDVPVAVRIDLQHVVIMNRRILLEQQRDLLVWLPA